LLILLLPFSFPLTDWDASQENPEKEQLWEGDWDDDNVNNDFSRRLKEELAKQGK
jgi:26 proteasome complex subunit DSS1